MRRSAISRWLAQIGATVFHLLPIWGCIRVVPFATGLTGWCPMYLPFGFETCNPAR